MSVRIVVWGGNGSSIELSVGLVLSRGNSVSYGVCMSERDVRREDESHIGIGMLSVQSRVVLLECWLDSSYRSMQSRYVQ